MKLPAFIVSLLLILLFSNCSTDFELEADWQDIPVVYGFISVQDTAHYLRVEKAFLERGGDARAIAQFADSLYYDVADISVRLEKTQTGQVYELERVDGNLEGYPREEGPFAQSPNYLYKIKADAINLSGGERLRLLIDRGDELDPVTATTDVLGEVLPRNTSPSNPINVWDYNTFLNFSWAIGEDDRAQIFDLRLFIHYQEIDLANPASVENKTVEWIVNRKILRNNQSQERFTYEILGQDFYKFLGQAIEPVPNRQRIFEGLDIQIASGGQELVDLDRVLQANAGITSSQAVPVYTNLSEGRGIFSSRYVARREGIQLRAVALDSLIAGIHTRNLNFREP